MNDPELVSMARFRLREAARRLEQIAALASDRQLAERLVATAASIREADRALGQCGSVQQPADWG